MNDFLSCFFSCGASNDHSIEARLDDSLPAKSESVATTVAKTVFNESSSEAAIKSSTPLNFSATVQEAPQEKEPFFQKSHPCSCYDAKDNYFHDVTSPCITEKILSNLEIEEIEHYQNQLKLIKENIGKVEEITKAHNRTLFQLNNEIEILLSLCSTYQLISVQDDIQEIEENASLSSLDENKSGGEHELGELEILQQQYEIIDQGNHYRNSLIVEKQRKKRNLFDLLFSQDLNTNELILNIQRTFQFIAQHVDGLKDYLTTLTINPIYFSQFQGCKSLIDSVENVVPIVQFQISSMQSKLNLRILEVNEDESKEKQTHQELIEERKYLETKLGIIDESKEQDLENLLITLPKKTAQDLQVDTTSLMAPIYSYLKEIQQVFNLLSKQGITHHQVESLKRLFFDMDQTLITFSLEVIKLQNDSDFLEKSVIENQKVFDRMILQELAEIDKLKNLEKQKIVAEVQAQMDKDKKDILLSKKDLIEADISKHVSITYVQRIGFS